LIESSDTVEHKDAEGRVIGLQLARRLGLFDATMIVMGKIIGSGIFINPYVVARQVHTPALILGAWLMGGCDRARRSVHLRGACRTASGRWRIVCLST